VVGQERVLTMKIFDELMARGLVAQMTHPEEVENALNNERISFYIGFDATASSLHVGSLLQLITMRRLQLAGHRPILLVGGATTRIGDPSGKQDMRKMLTDDDIAYNIECFKKQFERFLDIEGCHLRDAEGGVPYNHPVAPSGATPPEEGNGEISLNPSKPLDCFGDKSPRNDAIIVNNDDWVGKMNVYEFIRLGFNFNMNDMLRQECYATRRESGGLTLGEMCYLPMQSVDFAFLHDNYDCRMQMGGNDQWSNILGGVNLIRKTKGEKGNVFGMTFNLLTTADGKKMGKTEKGAIWLDSERTSPYEFFQYWRNVGDEDVIKSLNYLTFISMEEIGEMAKWEGAQLNKAKEILAFELTKMVHGEEEANKALEASKALFGGNGDNANMPTTKMDVGDGIGLLDLLMGIELIPSKGEGRRLIQQGGITLNDKKIDNIEYIVKEKDFTNGELIIRKGKKIFHKIMI